MSNTACNATEFLKSVHIRNFRSLVDVDIPLGKLNVLFGPTGSGKTNIVHFLEMLRFMCKYKQLNEFTAIRGGARDQLFNFVALHGGSETRDPLFNDKDASSIHAKICTDKDNEYRFSMQSYTTGGEDRFRMTSEQIRNGSDEWIDIPITKFTEGRRANIAETAMSTNSAFAKTDIESHIAYAVVRLMSDCMAYRFHDTSHQSVFHRSCNLSDSSRLRSEGNNLASVLYRLKLEDPNRLDQIQHDIRRVLPAFREFDIDTKHHNAMLQWKPNNSDKLLGTHLTSCGSLNLFAIITLLNLPRKMLPRIVILDEPASRLHHLGALDVVADLIGNLSRYVQVIVATQSTYLAHRLYAEKKIRLSCIDGRTRITQVPFIEIENDMLEHISTSSHIGG